MTLVNRGLTQLIACLWEPALRMIAVGSVKVRAQLGALCSLWNQSHYRASSWSFSKGLQANSINARVVVFQILRLRSVSKAPHSYGIIPYSSTMHRQDVCYQYSSLCFATSEACCFPFASKAVFDASYPVMMIMPKCTKQAVTWASNSLCLINPFPIVASASFLKHVQSWADQYTRLCLSSNSLNAWPRIPQLPSKDHA